MSGKRCILITGAGRGLGRACAEHLAAPGALLLLHYGRSAEGARETARLAEARGAETHLLQADLASPPDRERMMATAGGVTGNLQVLLNTAGEYAGTGLLEAGPDEWTRMMEINCNAVFHLTSLALPLLRAGAPARVVNLGDSAADRITARVQATAYHASKLGAHLLTRSLGKVLAGEGITVNMISPGFLENSSGDPGSPIPAGRKGHFQDVLAALDYLLSEEAGYVSGANIVVSGGWNL